MRRRWILASVVAATLVVPAMAQHRDSVQPPPGGNFIRVDGDVIQVVPPDSSIIAELLTTSPQLPLGPRDVLNEYEKEMISVVQDACDKLAQIAVAVRQGQISAEQAEYASGQTYALALMQFQMLSTLHEILENTLDKEAERESKPAVGNSSTATSPSSGGTQGSRHHVLGQK